MRTALLLIAHGSREPAANADLHRLAAEMRSSGECEVVAPAFLELAEPTIDEAAKRCVDELAERVILVPYFLSAGVHVRRDLQAHRDRLASEYPEVEFLLAQPLGPHPLLVEILWQRAQLAADEQGARRPSDG